MWTVAVSMLNAMSIVSLISLFAKLSFILLLLILILGLLRHESAARRLFVAQLSVLALLLLPVIWHFLPSSHIALPLAWSALTDLPLTLPDLPGLSYFTAAPVAEISAFSWTKFLIIAYASVASILLLRVIISIFRLYRLRVALPYQPSSEISVHTQQQWQNCLTRLCHLYGIKRPVQLIISDRIRSPLSWGIFRPVIMVDYHTSYHFEPDDVLTHELAHIAHFDWISLTLARLAAALYWFHPLVWLMLKQLSFNMECATDDTVLNSGATPSTYANTLMRISQHANTSELAATPLATKGKSLVARIISILEPQQQREAVSKKAWLTSVLATVVLALPLGTLTFIGEQIVWPSTLFAQTQYLNTEAGIKAAEELDKLNNPNFNALAAALRAGNYEIRHSLHVASFRQRAAIAPLVLALHDDKPKLRQLALWGLSEMQFPETAPVIARFLIDQDPSVRAEAVRALGDMHDNTWTPNIIALLKDKHALVRASAAHALGDLADPRSINALKAGLNDTHADVLEEIQWALREM
jgi:beta-lactamase regulating signal transducer with metallopeptidase domain